jgi:ribosome-binding factor A
MLPPKPPSRRLQRVAELLKRELAEILRRELSIDDFGLLTVNDVHVASDLRNATAFIGFVGTQAQRRALPDKLAARAARFQQLLAPHLRLKWTPVISFVLDESIERGNRVLAILEDLQSGSPSAPTPNPNKPDLPLPSR